MFARPLEQSPTSIPLLNERAGATLLVASRNQRVLQTVALLHFHHNCPVRDRIWTSPASAEATWCSSPSRWEIFPRPDQWTRCGSLRFRDPPLLDLNPEAVTNADKSTTGATNFSIIWVRRSAPTACSPYRWQSGDHEAGEYGFIGFGTDQSPLTARGNPQPFTIPLAWKIPDGTPDNPH